MKTVHSCIPCFVKQTVELTERFQLDSQTRDLILRDILITLGKMDYSLSPPHIAQQLHRLIRVRMNQPDPFWEIKKRHTQLALQYLPRARAMIAQASDWKAKLVQLAIAGNVIDLGARSDLAEQEVHDCILQALETSWDAEVEEFYTSIQTATSIMYLADNAGELVFDRLLIEHLPHEKITLAVKGAPVINDALREDAKQAGLDAWVKIIDNGSDVPGTSLPQCNAAFKEAFDQADLVIAKGQGHFESLWHYPKDIFFLFKVKCPHVAMQAGRPVGSHVLLRNR